MRDDVDLPAAQHRHGLAGHQAVEGIARTRLERVAADFDGGGCDGHARIVAVVACWMECVAGAARTKKKRRFRGAPSKLAVPARRRMQRLRQPRP
jgi:hypothetical protein